MAAELWGSRVKLKRGMNRAIFQGIAAAEASGASGQKALKRPMGKGPGVAPGLAPGQHVFLLSQLLSRACCYRCPPDRGGLQSIAGQ